MAYLTPSPKMQFFTANGIPLVGGKLYTYVSGTTTPLATYVDQLGSASNPNPVIMDSRGEAGVWLANSQLYTMVLKDSLDNLIWTSDGVGSSGSTPLASTFKVQNFSGDGTTVAFVLTYEPPNENNTQIYINGAYQQKNTYSLAASTITFSSAPPLGTDNIEVMTIATLSFGYIDSSLVNYIPAGVGAVPTNVQAKLHNYISAVDFGATGDGVTDDTVEIQAAIAALPTGGILEGHGKTYVVKACKLKSNMTLQNFNFKTKAGAVPAEYWSPVTIGANGDTALRENIIIRNVHVNGNRLNNMTGSVAFPEDGGKHGFRLIGNINNVVVQNCSAQYCGSYGFFLYRGLNTATIPFADVATISNVRIIDCVSRYNKAHGGAVDSVDEFVIDGGTYTHNGLDYFSDPGGLTLGGSAYSNAWDFEGYGVGSRISNVIIRNVDMRHNAAGSLYIQDPVLTTEPRFVIRNDIVIENIQADTGGHPLRLNPYTAVIITAPFANWSLGSIYKNVSISGGNILGEINFACVDDMRIDVPQVVIRDILGEAAYSNRVECITSSSYSFTNLFSADITTKRPVVYQTGAWNPVMAGATGVITSYTATGTYVKIGRQVTLNVKYTITNNGTGASYGQITNLPFSANTEGGSASTCVGGTTGKQCAVDISGITASIWQYDNVYPWATGATGQITMTYQATA